MTQINKILFDLLEIQGKITVLEASIPSMDRWVNHCDKRDIKTMLNEFAPMLEGQKDELKTLKLKRGTAVGMVAQLIVKTT